MAHYNEINVQKLYIACKSLEDFINEKVEAMNLGGKDYTAVLTRMSDQILSLSNALQSADPDNAGVTLLKTLSDDFAVEAGKVEGTSYSEILTMINSLTAIVSVVKKKISVPIRTSTDSALEKKTGDMYYDQTVKKFAFVTESDTGVATVSNFSVEGHKHTEADITGLTDKLNELKTSSDKVFQGMIEEKTDNRDPAADIYKYYAVDGGEIYLGTIDKKLKGIYSETSDIERILVSKDVDYVKTDLHENPGTGQIRTYFKTDGNLYKRDENGDESKIGSNPDFVYTAKDSGEIWLGSDAIKLGGIIAKQGNFQNVDVTNDIILEGNSLKVKLNNLEAGGGSGFEGLTEKKTTDAVLTVYEYSKKEDNSSIIIGSIMKPINMINANVVNFQNAEVADDIILQGDSLKVQLNSFQNSINSLHAGGGSTAELNVGSIYCTYLESSSHVCARNNNEQISQLRVGDGNYCQIAEYGTHDSDQLSLYGNKGIYSNVEIAVTSDRNYKKNIENYVISNPLEKVLGLELKSFNLIDENVKEGREEKQHIGYIAQEVNEIYTEAVEVVDKYKTNVEGKYLFNEDGTKMTENKYHIKPFYITLLQNEAIKELTTRVQELTTRITALENK
jgi:hypothetical protein